MKTKKEKVVLYMRTGSNDEEQLNRQKIKLTKYCKNNRYKIKKVFKDFNCSGRKNNPQLKELVTYISKNNIDKVIVTHFDRISRNIETIIYFLDVLNQYNCLMETIDNCSIEIIYGSKKLNQNHNQ